MSYEPGQSRRQRELEELHKDVPGYLRPLLWTWIRQRVVESNDQGATLAMIGNLLRVELPPGRRFDIARLERLCYEPATQLTVIEDLLRKRPNDHRAADLEDTLFDARSAYTVAEDKRGLAWRVDPTLTEQIRRVVDEAAEQPSHWLAEGWNAAYARTPVPRTAYDSAILAVEAAYGPLVIPTASPFTLGKIINALREGRAKFTVELVDTRENIGNVEPFFETVETVLGMMRAIAYGQRIRHGTDGDVTVNNIEEARVALHLAVTLVQMATSGALRRR